MPSINLNNFLDDNFEFLDEHHKRDRGSRKQRRSPEKVLAELADQVEGSENFEFTYNASRHERVWITDSLGGFFDQQWLYDVLRLLKGGKEASVYQCSADPNISAAFIAAKVYRPRRFRNLKKDHIYREGRDRLDADGKVIQDGGMQHAMNKRTAFGLELLHTSWIEHEFKTLQFLHAAGADVPIPYASGNNAILMEYIGDEDTPAPTMNSIELMSSEARPLFERVVHNIELMLANNRVHGDLSAYNILYWGGDITLIDFPQAIHPDRNQNAFAIFERDVRRICEYFARQGVLQDAHKLAVDLWKSHHHSLKPRFDLHLLDADNEGDRKFWEAFMDEDG
jgi:RIO kinase 1